MRRERCTNLSKNREKVTISEDVWEKDNYNMFLEFCSSKEKNWTLIGSLCCPSFRLTRALISRSRGCIDLKLISNIQVYGPSEHRKNQASKSKQTNADTSVLLQCASFILAALSKPIEYFPWTYSYEIWREVRTCNTNK